MRSACIVLGLLLCLVRSPVALAERAETPIRSLIEGSPLIVVGTLKKVNVVSRKGVDAGEGKIVVHEVLFGKARPDEEFTLKWSNPTGLACPRIEHQGAQDQKLIWIFESLDKSEVTAKPEGRLLLDKKQEVLEVIAASKTGKPAS